MDEESIIDEIVQVVSHEAVSDVFGAWKYLRYVVRACRLVVIADEFAQPAYDEESLRASSRVEVAYRSRADEVCARLFIAALEQFLLLNVTHVIHM